MAITIPDHKLCAYVTLVLNSTQTLTPSTPLDIFRDENHNVGFVTQNGIVLSLINSGSGSGSGKKLSKIGLVNGSVSVVHKIWVLVNAKCLRIHSRVVRSVAKREVRVVVLVDVYLNIGLWCGWQFPRSKSTAAALFRHLRYILFYY